MTRRDLFLLPLVLAHAPAARAEDDGAVLLVTGMRIGAGPSGETRDLSVAEGASVAVTPDKAAPLRKNTAALVRESRGETFFTADFPLALDASCEIVMTFRDGTAIRISDYRLPSNWKTHFLFHNTRGTKSPACILRKQSDPGSGLSCWVYALWPVAAYEQMTGRRLASG